MKKGISNLRTMALVVWVRWEENGDVNKKMVSAVLPSQNYLDHCSVSETLKISEIKLIWMLLSKQSQQCHFGTFKEFEFIAISPQFITMMQRDECPPRLHFVDAKSNDMTWKSSWVLSLTTLHFTSMLLLYSYSVLTYSIFVFKIALLQWLSYFRSFLWPADKIVLPCAMSDFQLKKTFLGHRLLQMLQWMHQNVIYRPSVFSNLWTKSKFPLSFFSKPWHSVKWTSNYFGAWPIR